MGIAVQQPLQSSQNGRFTIGRDADGHWIVCDRKGLVGGLFKDRASAVHFALEESDRIPGAVCCAPESTILRIGAVFEAGTPSVQQSLRSGSR